MSERRRPGPVPKLSRDAVLNVARDMPPEGLTLAAIGAKLGVTGPALYRYFPDRTAILEALANEAREQLIPPDPSLPWDEWLRHAATAERNLWQANPNLYEAANYRAISRPVLGLMRAGLEVLTAAGFSITDAFCTMTLLSELAHAFGWAGSHSEQLTDPADVNEFLKPLIGGMTVVDLDGLFRHCAELAIDGLRTRLPQ